MARPKTLAVPGPEDNMGSFAVGTLKRESPREWVVFPLEPPKNGYLPPINMEPDVRGVPVKGKRSCPSMLIEPQSKPGTKVVNPEPCKEIGKRPQLFLAGTAPY